MPARAKRTTTKRAFDCIEHLLPTGVGWRPKHGYSIRKCTRCCSRVWALPDQLLGTKNCITMPFVVNRDSQRADEPPAYGTRRTSWPPMPLARTPKPYTMLTVAVRRCLIALHTYCGAPRERM